MDHSQAPTAFPVGPAAAIPPAVSAAASGSGSLAMILSALLIAMTIVGIMAFCVWMCGCGPEEPPRNGGRVKAVQAGMGRDAIERLPTMSYSAAVMQRNDADLGCCSVCLVEFGKEDERIRVMPKCGHCFHPDCISMWLFSHTSCPMCRSSLVDRNPSRVMANAASVHACRPDQTQDHVVLIPVDEGEASSTELCRGEGL